MRRDEITAAATIIRESVSARDYAERLGIQVNRGGLAHCPFHDGDRGASLKLYGGDRGWYCYGCNAHGDVIELAKRFYGIGYVEAITKVSEDMGIAIPTSGRRTDHRKLKEAIARSDWLKAEQRRKEELKTAIETRYWMAFDEWRQADLLVQELADKERQTPEQGFSDEFAKAILDRQEKKAILDYLIIWRDNVC